VLASVIAGLMCAPECRPKNRIIEATVKPKTRATSVSYSNEGMPGAREATTAAAGPTKTRM